MSAHCVVIDPFFSRSARHADVVLPGSTFAEEAGTITTIEGRVVRIDQAVEPVAGRADLDIIRELGGRLGAGEHVGFSTASEVFAEMREVSAGGPVDYAGITYDRLREEDGIFWPCPSTDHPGTPQLYTERFHHPDGRARFHPITGGGLLPVSATTTSAGFPLVLTTGRGLAQFLSGNQTMRIQGQNDRSPEPIVEVHPDTASANCLVEGQAVHITSRLGTEEFLWQANPYLRPDTLFLPYHWPACNRLIAADLDPISKIPGFKYTPVRVRPVSPVTESCPTSTQTGATPASVAAEP